jgi:hypothetical protein
MATAGFQMWMNDLSEVRGKGSLTERSGSIGWNDSSWDLLRGLDVVEDLPLDAWPLELLAFQPAQAT